VMVTVEYSPKPVPLISPITSRNTTMAIMHIMMLITASHLLFFLNQVSAFDATMLLQFFMRSFAVLHVYNFQPVDKAHV